MFFSVPNLLLPLFYKVSVVTMKSNIPDIFFNSCFKNNNKKNGFDLKNVYISQKKIGKQICYHSNHDNMCITFF